MTQLSDLSKEGDGVLFSEVKNVGGAGLWADAVFRFGHVKCNVL